MGFTLQTLKLVIRHRCFREDLLQRDLALRAQIPLSESSLLFPSSISPPRHAPLPPDIHRRRRTRPPRRRALPPAAVLPRKTPHALHRTVVPPRSVGRRRPARRQRRPCCRREGPGILLAGPCGQTSRRDTHRTGQNAGRRDGEQDRKCQVSEGFRNGLCHGVWHEAAPRV